MLIMGIIYCHDELLLFNVISTQLRETVKYTAPCRRCNPKSLQPLPVCFNWGRWLHVLSLGGHDQSELGSHQTLDYSASDRDSGVRG